MTRTNDLAALAEACERAAEDISMRLCCGDYPRAMWCLDCEQDEQDADRLAAHARALRAGRVTIREEAP